MTLALIEEVNALVDATFVDVVYLMLHLVFDLLKYPDENAFFKNIDRQRRTQDYVKTVLFGLLLDFWSHMS